MNTEKKRNLSYDRIRILAMAAVVMIHCASGWLFACSGDDPSYRLAAVFDGFARCAVPMFVMLSGALMLDENRRMDIPRALKYAGRIALLLVVWTLVYAVKTQVFDVLRAGAQISRREFVKSALLGQYHLWYLYMIIGLYLITPVLRLFVKTENQKPVLYFLLLSVLFGFIRGFANLMFNRITGTEDYIAQFLDQFQMGFVNPFVAYYLMGWYLTHVSRSRKTRNTIYGLGILGLAAVIGGTILFSTADSKAYGVFMEDGGIFSMLYSVGLFTWMLDRYGNREPRSQRAGRLLVRLSGLTFGVYVIHLLVMFELKLHFFMGRSALWLPLLWVLTMALSLALTFVISRIPGLKKLIRC